MGRWGLSPASTLCRGTSLPSLMIPSIASPPPFLGHAGTTRELRIGQNMPMHSRHFTRDTSRHTESRLRQSFFWMGSAPFLVLCLLGVPMPASRPCQIWMPFSSWSSEDSSSPPPGQRFSSPPLVIVPSTWEISVSRVITALLRPVSSWPMRRSGATPRWGLRVSPLRKLRDGEQPFPHLCNKGWLQNCKGKALRYWAVACLYPPHQLLRLHEWQHSGKRQHLWA